MEVWQIDIIKIVVPAAISAVGGWWAHWSWTKKERVKAALQQQQRQVEYDDFKKRRRLIGAGDVEKMERADRLTDLIIKQKQHQITPEEFKLYRDDLIAGRKQRDPKTNAPTVHHVHVQDTITIGGAVTQKRAAPHIYVLGENVVDLEPTLDSPPNGAAIDRDATARSSGEDGKLDIEQFVKLAPFDDRLTEEQRRLIAVRLMAVLKEKGPNDFPVGFLENGDKVEWLPSEPEDIEEGADPFWPMPLLRNEDEIHAASEEFFDKAWWNRHQLWIEKIASGDEPLREDQKAILETAKAAAKRIEHKYGRENLGWDDFEWGMVNGKLSALRWVGGSEWDFLDT